MTTPRVGISPWRGRRASRGLGAATALAVILSHVPRVVVGQDGVARPAPIQDNSFLIEEAYNQEPRVVQHIATFTRARTGGDWAFSFTQEWPAASQRHQLSYTVPVLRPAGAGGTAGGRVGDVALNYRYQLAGVHGERIAFAPRLSLLLPTGSADAGTGAGGAGLQANLPLSVELSDRFVTHLNAGATVTPRAHGDDGATARTTSFNAGQSLVWLAASRINGLLEVSWARVESVVGPGVTTAESQLVLAPGVRWAYDLPHDTQIVPGLALPIGIGPSRGSQALLLYFSVEHPF